MAKRVGKYKITKRESALNLSDGGAVAGNLEVTGTSTLTGATTATGGITLGQANALQLISKTATSATIAVTDDTDYAVPAITQPAGTFLKDVIFLNAGNIVTAGSSGNDLDFEIGTAASGGQIVALTALLDDGGAAVTWTANTPLFVIANGEGVAANQFATTGVGPKGGPATTEAIVLAGATYSSAARDLHVNFRANGADLTTAATTVKVIMVFQYI
tara:strand:- start:49 stop:699 length:651 start_codon:yes stop_codon:yes gene_type:complete